MKKRSNNPWELLIISALFIVIGAAIMYCKVPIVITGGVGGTGRSGSGLSTGADAETASAVGLVGILLGVAIGVFYLKLKHDINRDDPS
jgi:hypothetical protein